MANEKKISSQEPKNTTSPPQIEVSARPIKPIGNLVGFASVKFNNSFVVEDFKILQGDKGLFIGMPSKPDAKSNTGYRDMAKPITADFRTELIKAVVSAYHTAVKNIQTRAAAITTPTKSIKEQLAVSAEKAKQHNASLTITDKEIKKQNPER